MSEELEVLKTVADRLNRADIPYMISGSIAANYYTIPRMTRDIDIVVELKESDIESFIKLFRDEFYFDEDVVKKEVSNRGMFNLIYNRYILKVDFIVKKESEYQIKAFLRKKEVIIDDTKMWLISAEDLILSKLLWSKESKSEIQLRDVDNLIETATDLDKEYIKEWMSKLELKEVYKIK